MRILVVDDEKIVRLPLVALLSKLGHAVEECGHAEEAVELFARNSFDIALVDVRLPGMDGLTLLGRLRELQPDVSVIMVTGYATMEAAISALRAGAADFLSKPLRISELSASIEKAARLKSLREEGRRLRQTVGELQFPAGLTADVERVVLGESAAIHQIRGTIRLAASGACPSVLITGETGVGKEVVARALHLRAHARSDPFIAVSCPALPDPLVESELFGHAKGAFTGAIGNRAGAFELADGGTLFLDEVSELSAQAQAKLLRALETRVVRRVGGNVEIPVKVMIVAATNRDLERMIAEGTFRSDLYYRLNTLHIHIPPLRDRVEDILPLARHFLGERRNRGHDVLAAGGLSQEVAAALRAYDYPGNARELRSIIERACILAGNGEIRPEHLLLPKPRRIGAASQATHAAAATSVAAPPSDPEAAETLRVLRECKWHRGMAAETLGVTYSALRWRIAKHRLAERS